MTVTLPQDSNRRRVQGNESAFHAKHPRRGRKSRREGLIRNRQNEGVPQPTQSVPVEGRLCHFVKLLKPVMNDPYLLSI